MADITSVYQTYNNSGSGVAQADDNSGKHVITQADVGRELVIQVTKSGSGNLTDAILTAVRAQLTLAGGDGSGTDVGGPDAFTVAAFGTADGSAFATGTTTDVFFRIQGTGTPNTSTVSGATITVLATFAPAL